MAFLSPLILASYNLTVNLPNSKDLLIDIMKNPKSLIAFVIQMLLGFGLGYYSLKVIKYILALIAIFVIGGLLNIWSLSGSNVNLQQLYSLLKPLIVALSIRLTLPILLGLLIGLIVAAK
ncbi:MAG: hypothetical protein B6U69_04210 [Thermofilum sp. ex4484_15]|nr:MAG: hypothetical protein B6U69_04210 [Thermofilum sp. ex4484_15]